MRHRYTELEFDRRSHRRVSNGFTLVELLVVVAVIASLLGILLPAVQHALTTAKLTNEKAAARDLMLAHQMYTDEHKGWVMPGYIDGVDAFTDQGNRLQSPLSSRYPWRIAPYLDYRFEALYKNDAVEDLEAFRTESPESYEYVVSLFPSLGLNSAFVGGDSRHSGFLERPDDGSPYLYDLTGQFYVRRQTDVRQPHKLIVFASARGGDPSSGAFDRQYEGYFSILSPYWLPTQGLRWNEVYSPSDPPDKFGNLSLRYHGSAVTAMFDGHVETQSDEGLKDMRRWCHLANTRDWRLGDSK